MVLVPVPGAPDIWMRNLQGRSMTFGCLCVVEIEVSMGIRGLELTEVPMLIATLLDTLMSSRLACK